MITAPPGETQFDQYAQSYDDVVNQSLGILPIKLDYFTRVKAGYLLQLLREHSGTISGTSLMDVGCGTGNMHPLLIGELGAVSGVDVSQECLDRAAKRNPQVAYQHYDGTRLPYADASFDAVTTICVMHHVPPAQWPAFVGELRRVLKPGGITIIFEHNPRNPLTRRVVNDCEFDHDAVLLTMREVRELLGEAGFRRIDARSILSIPTFGKLTRRIDLGLGHLGLGAQYFVQAVA